MLPAGLPSGTHVGMFLCHISELLPLSHCFGFILPFLFRRVKLAVKFREAKPRGIMDASLSKLILIPRV